MARSAFLIDSIFSATKRLAFRYHILGGLALALLFAGCSGNKPAPSATEQSAPPPEQPAPTQIVDPATAAAITGRVTLEGTPPAPKPILIAGSPECAKMHPSPLDYPAVVTGEPGALADVVVYVKSGLENYRFDTPQAPAVMDQKGCMYEPHVLALMTNQRLEVDNTDPLLHNVLVVPRANRTLDKSQPIGSAPIEMSFDRPELAIQVLCNIHPWMRAYVFVFSNPYFAVTPKTGKFELKHLPPGTYTIEAWQEKYGTQDQSVTVAPKQSKAISFTFKSNPS